MKALRRFTGLIAIALPMVAAAELPAPLQAKVDGYVVKLVEWSQHPEVVAAVAAANAAGGIAGMNNAAWLDVPDDSPMVQQMRDSAAGKLVVGWGADPALEKLSIRDEKGNLIATAATKPLLYNNATKPSFVKGIQGPWHATEAKPDPTSQQVSVQIAAPVMAGGKAIGLIHSAVAAH